MIIVSSFCFFLLPKKIITMIAATNTTTMTDRNVAAMPYLALSASQRTVYSAVGFSSVYEVS
ncbi:MAG: hypothetical protein CO088_00690 [Candidatus Yonathbacteria bacterium CG_4_9_14_0_8_um_filter_46_47]|uniref:Uncharacterized protein n=1 Tax=Candidatus Yonathbacteria bacterium CG_4_9_14_0_8_um_filter_46_47 TaxID=1975106 RepID=A0A2M8D9E2_9BACT|nr:MAG: hypothetical protein CO088_00690 [Candidatus Yonathbacteria bacterium CG_4_9_14_0_8_um_filter_46_47]